ncbi:MAG: DUF5011 domain-containing protein, partial [Chitinivibrionales bacterium]
MFIILLFSGCNNSGSGPEQEAVGDTIPPEITLKGEAEMSLAVNQEYNDPGATAVDNRDGDITERIEITPPEEKVSTATTGSDTIVYKASDSAGNTTRKTRKIIIMDSVDIPEDTTPPEITLIGETEMLLEVNQEYNDPGATAVDNRDGDITERIEVSGEVNTSIPGTYRIDYSVTDNAGNTGTAQRAVTVPDNEPPVITLKGDNPYTLSIGDVYTDPGYSASDNVDGNLTSDVSVDHDIDMGSAGEYTVTYSVSDAAGNSSSETRSVIVVDNSVPPHRIGEMSVYALRTDGETPDTSFNHTRVYEYDQHGYMTKEKILNQSGGQIGHFDVTYDPGTRTYTKKHYNATGDYDKYEKVVIDEYGYRVSRKVYTTGDSLKNEEYFENSYSQSVEGKINLQSQFSDPEKGMSEGYYEYDYN